MRLDELFAHWEHVRHGLLSTMDLFEEEELAYRPFGESWTVGDLMRHVPNAEAGWFQYVVRGKLPAWPVHEAEGYATIGAIQELMAGVHAETMEYLAGFGLEELNRPVSTPWGETLTLSWVTWHVLEHEIHHRGELSLILGLLGRKGLEV